MRFHWAVGYNNIDIEAAQARGVPVCTSPGYNAASVAEGAIMMMLMLVRRVHEQEVLSGCLCSFDVCIPAIYLGPASEQGGSASANSL